MEFSLLDVLRNNNIKKVVIIAMSAENELLRLTKENDNLQKIIKTQQNTINQLVDYFILGKKPSECSKQKQALR